MLKQTVTHKQKIKNFNSAYSIKGRGVGHLELQKAVQSDDFLTEVKILASKVLKLKIPQTR